jgi:hypothetical protein
VPPTPYTVRMGRSDGSVTKTIWTQSKKQAMHIANSVAYLLWLEHPFKPRECEKACLVEKEGKWLEVKPTED